MRQFAAPMVSMSSHLVSQSSVHLVQRRRCCFVVSERLTRGSTVDSPLLLCAVLLSSLSDACPKPSACDFVSDTFVVVVVVVCLKILFGHVALVLVIVIVILVIDYEYCRW